MKCCDSPSVVARAAHAVIATAAVVAPKLDVGIAVIAFELDSIHVSFVVPEEWRSHLPSVLAEVARREEQHAARGRS